MMVVPQIIDQRTTFYNRYILDKKKTSNTPNFPDVDNSQHQFFQNFPLQTTNKHNLPEIEQNKTNFETFTSNLQC